MLKISCYLIISLLFLLIVNVASDCTCDNEDLTRDLNKNTLKYKIGAIVTILTASALGIALPIAGKNFPALRPESKFFFIIKAFAAGVILSTGFIHILPDAFHCLTNLCLKKNPWKYPFAGLAAMVGSLGSLMIDAFATGHYRKLHFGKGAAATVDEEMNGDHTGHVHLHTHATHGHAHGPADDSAKPEGLSELDSIRYMVISQVLEMGIVVHSVIIGISLGTSESLSRTKALMAALCFHQFFEGIGLGGCIAQASFKSGSTICMALFFSLTTPVGIAIGIGIASFYNDSSPTALIIQGLLNSCAAGILIYMALVDLLAQDFMNPKMLTNTKLFLSSNVSLLLGAAFMAVLAIWA